MKRYVRTVVINDRRSEKFEQALADAISEFQQNDLQVEIQFSTSLDSYTALVLGYKEVSK